MGYSVEAVCKLLHISRAAYLRWASGKQSARTIENTKIAEKVEQIHMENPDKGYRRINDDLRHNEHMWCGGAGRTAHPESRLVKQKSSG